MPFCLPYKLFGYDTKRRFCSGFIFASLNNCIVCIENNLVLYCLTRLTSRTVVIRTITINHGLLNEPFYNSSIVNPLVLRNREILELGLDNEDSEHENDDDTNQSKPSS